jgi:hypothetical protein
MCIQPYIKINHLDPPTPHEIFANSPPNLLCAGNPIGEARNGGCLLVPVIRNRNLDNGAAELVVRRHGRQRRHPTYRPSPRHCFSSSVGEPPFCAFFLCVYLLSRSHGQTPPVCRSSCHLSESPSATSTPSSPRPSRFFNATEPPSAALPKPSSFSV